MIGLPGGSVTVVVPAYNEAPNLPSLVEEVRAALDPLGIDWELVVVDDGSDDNTPAMLASLAASDPCVRPLRLARRSGQTAALAAGFEIARGELIATLDADLQCPPADLPRLIEALGDADMACGVRAGRRDPAARRVASMLANMVRRFVLAPEIRDLACPLRVFRASAIARLRESTSLFDGAHRWLPVLFVLAGLRVVQRPVAHRPRTAGVSKYTTRGRLIPIARETGRVFGLALGRWRALRVSAVVLVLLAVSAPLFYRLGHWPLMEPDEGRNAEVAREMLARGSWVVPHFNGLPYLDKPVVFFWMVASAFRAVGVSEIGARLPAAVSAVLLILLTFAIARRLLGTRRGLVAAVIAATAPMVLVFGRITIFDMPFTMIVTFAFWCLLEGRLGRHPGILIPLAGLAMGLATLTKGPVGVVVPVLAWLAARGALPSPERSPGMRPVLVAMLLFAGVVAPWTILVASEEPEFLRYALLDETLLRFASPERFNRPGPVYYHLLGLLWGLGVWSFVLVGTGPDLVRRWRAGRPDADAMAIRFTARAAGAILLFFSVCASKRPGYILPAIVPLSILISIGVTAAPRRAAGAIRAFAWVALPLALAGLAAALINTWEWFPASWLDGRLTRMIRPLVMAAVGLLAWALVGVFFARNRPGLALVLGAVLAPSAYLMQIGSLAAYAESRSARSIARLVGAESDVVAFLTFRTSLPFYLRRPITLVSQTGEQLTSNYVQSQHERLMGRPELLPLTELPNRLRRPSSVYVLTTRWTVRQLFRLSPRPLRRVYEDRRTLLFVTSG